MQKRVFVKLEKHVYVSTINYKNKNRYIAIFGILPEIIQSVMPALFLIIGIKLIINNSLSLGSLIGFVSIVTMVMKPILSLVSSYNDFLLLNVYFQKLSEVLTYEEKMILIIKRKCWKRRVYL